MNRKPVYALLFVGCLMLRCEKFEDPDTAYTYTPPRAVDDGLAVSTLRDEGLDEALITTLTDRIVRDDYNRVDGFLIVRHNKLVYENYFHGYSEDVLHNIYSATKSITSILVGIALDKGFIKSIDTPILDLLPEYNTFQHPDPREREITIRHLLNMSSGLACDDWYRNTESAMQQHSDWVQFTLDLPMEADPGTRGSYCTGGVVILGRILANVSGMSVEAFANRYLFGPLGITRYQWHTMPNGRLSAGGLMFLRPRDMAKIGQLMLNQGVWRDQQIVSAAWVAASRDTQLTLPGPFDGYGYLWWKQSFYNDAVETYFASGNGGQYIFVIPSKDVVVVFTCGNQNTGLGLQMVEALNTYIIPAIQ